VDVSNICYLAYRLMWNLFLYSTTHSNWDNSSSD